MQDNVFQQGVDLMLFGMGTVFVFLTVLIFATSAMSAVVTKWFPEKPPEPSKNRTTGFAPLTGAPVTTATLRILQAAVDEHRQRNS